MMHVLRPRDLEEALGRLAADPGMLPLAGGTDVMVGINFGRLRPESVLSIRHLPELHELETGARIRCGAGLPFTTLLRAEAGLDPAFVQGLRTIGSAQIRNAGTLGGNLGTCSPAGDALPVLSALNATLVLRSARGERRLAFEDWMLGPRRSARRPDELLIAVEWDASGRSQVFFKIGTRNAMVIAVASLAMVVDRLKRRVRVALGSVAPVILRAREAERLAEGLFDESGWDRPLAAGAAGVEEFGRLAAAAAIPIDDVRGTAAYRRHAVGVMARRAIERTGALVA